ncbi:ras gtpase [Anaeramoeba ignava]|uniref:Ras gtpase n=1 Tax=Anaeramoeba ignava TaxID=1746090 RepID=A0A9Q0R8S3_ANAIG|nr:ras gtpase [Anaeramoeba ignava]
MENNKSFDYDLRIGIFGAGGVGKSSITIKFTHNMFIEEYDPNVEDEYTKEIELNDKKILLKVLDTTYPQEIYDPFPRWVEYSQVFVLIYSIIDKYSFDEILNYHNYSIKKIRKDYPKILIGNKSDLTMKREISIKQGKELARNLNCKYIETSAKTGENINQLFYESSLLAFEELKNKENQKSKSKSKSKSNEKEKRKMFINVKIIYFKTIYLI